jgi:DNA-binding response OmpR family regulator
LPHILSVSYDETLLSTRQLLLESRGYAVTSAEGFVEAMRLCKAGGYDLLIIGHSIPHTDKKALVDEIRTRLRVPVLVLLRQGEPSVTEATKSIDAGNPRLSLDAVAQLLGPAHSSR